MSTPPIDIRPTSKRAIEVEYLDSGAPVQLAAAPRGESAYQAWLAAGNEGTKEQFLAALQGERGEKGEQGDKGEVGPQGPMWAQSIVTLTGAGPHVLDGQHNYIRVDHDAPVQVEIPADMPAPDGEQLAIFQVGIGQTEIVAGAGVTIHAAESLFLRKQHSLAVLTRVDADVYDLTGDLEEAA